MRKWDIDGRKPEAPLCRSDYKRYPKVIFSFFGFRSGCLLLLLLLFLLLTLLVWDWDWDWVEDGGGHFRNGLSSSRTHTPVEFNSIGNDNCANDKRVADRTRKPLGYAERNCGKCHMWLQCHVVFDIGRHRLDVLLGLTKATTTTYDPMVSCCNVNDSALLRPINIINMKCPPAGTTTPIWIDKCVKVTNATHIHTTQIQSAHCHS